MTSGLPTTGKEFLALAALVGRLPTEDIAAYLSHDPRFVRQVSRICNLYMQVQAEFDVGNYALDDPRNIKLFDWLLLIHEYTQPSRLQTLQR